MQLFVLIQIPLDGEPYCDVYKSLDSALQIAVDSMLEDLEDYELSGPKTKKAAATMRDRITNESGYYCPHTESVWFIKERELQS